MENSQCLSYVKPHLVPMMWSDPTCTHRLACNPPGHLIAVLLELEPPLELEYKFPKARKCWGNRSKLTSKWVPRQPLCWNFTWISLAFFFSPPASAKLLMSLPSENGWIWATRGKGVSVLLKNYYSENSSSLFLKKIVGNAVLILLFVEGKRPSRPISINI